MDSVEILIDDSEFARSFWSWLMSRQSEPNVSFALEASFEPAPPMPTIRTGFVNSILISKDIL